MKMRLICLLFSIIGSGILQARSSERLTTEDQMKQLGHQSCMSGWVQTTSSNTETSQCIKVSNCTKGGVF